MDEEKVSKLIKESRKKLNFAICIAKIVNIPTNKIP